MMYDFRTLKLRARAALQGNWQTALLVSFFCGILSTVSSLVQALTPGSLTQADLMYGLADGSLTIQTAASQMTNNWPLTMIMGLVTMLFTPALALGANNYFLRLQRRQDSGFSTLLSRMSILFKALGLNVMIALKMLAWALPVMAVGLGIAYLTPVDTLRASSWLIALSSLLALAMLVVTVLAALRYSQATYVMADKPETGIMAAIRESKTMMKGNMGQYVLLELSFLGWGLLIVLVSQLAYVLLGSVLGIVVQLFAQVFLNAYINSTMVGYYLALKGEPEAEEDSEEA